MDHDFQQERQTYQLCQMGFAALSVSLVVATFCAIVALPIHLHGVPFMPWLVHSELWKWLDVPVVWGSVLGSYLLIGRFSTPSWQRRAGLLLAMCCVDAVLWGLDHADALGFAEVEFGHRWFRYSLGQALSWPEFALLASLSSDMLVHLGVGQAGETGRSTRSLAGTGAVVWMLLFMIRTDWRAGWPLCVRRVVKADMLILDLGATMIATIALIQVTALAIAATRQCSSLIAELRSREQGDHLFGDPLYEAGREFPGLLGNE